MSHYRDIEKYSVLEINGMLDSLRGSYDIVQLVDVEECRVLEVQPDGSIHYGRECYQIWNLNFRCANCSGYQACMTHCPIDKVEHLNGMRQEAHSVPIYLEMLNGELELCVLDCVHFSGADGQEDEDPHDDAVYISTHDVLTRLYTQEKLFWEIRKRLLKNPEDPYLLVMGNIRNFSLLNKLYGIEGGNRILVGIADILREECTHEEVYGRYRDDRFVLLVRKDKFDEKLFSDHLQRTRALLDSPIYTIQIQLGVYEVQDINLPVSTMMDHACLALNAIRDDRNILIAHYDPDMTERKLKRQHIISQFEEALQGDSFHIYLQPQVRADGSIFGAEALVRWMQGDGSVLLPIEFLDVLHQSDLLSHLDAYVWELAVRQLSRWTDTEFEDIYISVNVDPSDFYYFDVPRLLSELCARYGVDTRRLRVEITETALVNDIQNQSRIVEQLHQAGFLVEIDDFGKGSSSLSMLKDIHADVLKIDMGFVRGKTNPERSKIILGSVIEMAGNLNMDVITEGVETRKQVDDLLAMGCRGFQGFYYSRPIPVRDFETVAHHQMGGEEYGG